MKRKTRQLITVSAAAAFLAAVCLAVWFFSRQNTDAQSKQEALFNAGELKSVEMTVGNENIKLVKNGGFWYIDGRADFPLDQEIPAAMEKLLSPLSVQRTVNENNTEPETYGLGKYALKILFSAESGSGTLLIGDPCSAAPGWYFALGDESRVYLGDESLGTAFTFGTLNDMILLEPYPPVNAGSVTGLKTDALEIAVSSDGAFCDPENRFTVTIDGKAFMADDEAVEELAALAAALEPECCVRFGEADESVLARYGFTGGSILISYVDSGSVISCRILTGSADGNGHIYTMLEGSKQICLVHADDLLAFFDKPEQLLSYRVFPIIPGRLAKLKITNRAGKTEIERITKTAEDENGLMQTEVEYYCGTELADGGKADELIDALTAVKASDVGAFDPPEGEKVFSLEIELTDKRWHTIEIIQTGNGYYAVHNGVCWQRINDADADKLIKLIL